MTEPSPAAQPADGEPSAAGQLSRPERRARAVCDAMRTLLRDTYAHQFGAAVPRADDVELTFRFVAHPAGDWTLQFDPPALDQINDQLADLEAGRDVYRKGRVYCFRCETSDCEHTLPDTPLSVFSGYDTAGRPEWKELGQVLIELRHERVGSLYEPRSSVVSALQYGRDLRGRQLSAFGRSSKSYAVLAQVVSGYHDLPSGPGGKPERAAVTLQAVESRDARGRFALHLNSVARTSDGTELEVLLGGGMAPALERARRHAARAIDSLAGQVRTAREERQVESANRLLGRIPGIMRRLAEEIDRGERQGQRRTKHVESRRKENRPVGKALDDAAAAGRDQLYFEEKAETFAVVGDKGRTHIFNRDGRHVTSFLLKPEAVRRRLQSRRWRDTTLDEWKQFREDLSAWLPGAPAGEEGAAS